MTDGELLKHWCGENEVPPPNMGGSFVYCPHKTAEVVKEPKKRARTIYRQCSFKTRQLRRYARHYRRRHGDQAEQSASLAAVNEKIADSQAARKRTPKYPVGDTRRSSK